MITVFNASRDAKLCDSGDSYSLLILLGIVNLSKSE